LEGEKLVFRKYIDIENLGRDDVEGILDGEVHLFPKIDGMNAQMWYDGEIVRCGTRNKEVFEIDDKDARGLWKESCDNRYMAYFLRFPHHRLYGEWLIKSELWYKECNYNKFYVFDVYDENLKDFIPYNQYKMDIELAEIEYLPLIIVLKNTKEEVIKAIAGGKLAAYLMSYDSDIGEGVVIKNYKFKNKYGFVTWAKYVNEKPTKHYRTAYNSVNSSANNSSKQLTFEDKFEDKVVKRFLDEKDVQKRVSSLIVQAQTIWKTEMIPHLLNLCWYDLISEEMFGIIQYYNEPVIDFRALRRAMAQRIKEMKPHLFKGVNGV
jgi:RNA ligase